MTTMTHSEHIAQNLAEIAGAGHLILTLAKADTWDEALLAISRDEQLSKRIAHRLSEIGFEIQELDENTDVLAHQRRSPKISTAVCSGCNATALYAKTITKKCHITLGCTGQWLKPVAYTVKAQ